MAGISEIIRVEDTSALSFGNHELDIKAKIDDFEVDGDLYKLKTFKTMTKLEKNGRLLYESTPGTTVSHFELSEQKLEFQVEGLEDAQVTVELENDQEYKLFIDDVLVGKIRSNLAGKLNFSVDFVNGLQRVKITKA